MSSPDPAILSLLSLSSNTSDLTFSPHGSSSFTNTHTLISQPKSPSPSKIPTANLRTKKYFIKISSSSATPSMFAGEHFSLNTIAAAVPDINICPRSYGWGKLESREGWFLVTEFIDFGSRRSGTPKTTKTPSKKKSKKPLSLAQKLARLHTAPVPNWEDLSASEPTPNTTPSAASTTDTHKPTLTTSFSPNYGFPLATHCGDTLQPNPPSPNWPAFFSQNRLLAILEAGSAAGRDRSGEMRKVVERVISDVVPRLLGPIDSAESEPEQEKQKGRIGLVHGDLWSGNTGLGKIWRNGDLPLLSPSPDPAAAGAVAVATTTSEDSDSDEDNLPEGLLYDPSPTYASPEFELGMMKLFGGFDSSFMTEYHSLVPKADPVDEYEDRVSLYEAYHLLNHWVIFGGGYGGSAISSLQTLIGKYGGR